MPPSSTPRPARLRFAAAVTFAVAAAVGLSAYVAEREVDAAFARSTAADHDHLYVAGGAALLLVLVLIALAERWLVRPLAVSAGSRAPTGHGLTDSVQALAAAVDARDPYTRHHSERVAAYAARLGESLGLPAERVERLRVAGLLHDVGKLSVADSILLKPDALTDDEFAIMRGHSAGGEALARAAGMDDLAPWIRHHHERFGGGGYPDGIAGQDIPVESRILCVCETLEALTSSRAYRNELSTGEAMEVLDLGAGTQFDPAVVRALAGLLGESTTTADDSQAVPAPARVPQPA